MIHQLVFTKLLGELDYGAGTGIGDFNAAGCASCYAPAEPRASRGGLEQQQLRGRAGPGAGGNPCVRRRRGLAVAAAAVADVAAEADGKEPANHAGRARIALVRVLRAALVCLLRIALVRAGGG